MESGIQHLQTVKKESSMTYSINVTNTLLISTTDDLPQPDAVVAGISAGSGVSGLPRPARLVPDIADSGRVSFGAAMRLPLSK
jgi:hypothetical protein